MAKNITYEERFTIERMLKANYTLRDIARCICRAYSTIRHEVKRCIYANQGLTKKFDKL